MKIYLKKKYCSLVSEDQAIHIFKRGQKEIVDTGNAHRICIDLGIT